MQPVTRIAALPVQTWMPPARVGKRRYLANAAYIEALAEGGAGPASEADDSPVTQGEVGARKSP